MSVFISGRGGPPFFHPGDVTWKFLKKLFAIDEDEYVVNEEGGDILKRRGTGWFLRKGIIDNNPDKKKISRWDRPIGTKSASGHVYIQLKGVRYSAARLMWKWHYGVWPDKKLRYLNGDPGDYQIDNLEEIYPKSEPD